MAYETGSATDYQDLYDKLIAFLTTNADLVAAGQAWEISWQAQAGYANESDTLLRGPGLSAQDSIYVGLRLGTDVPSDAYWIEMVGATGALAGAIEYDGHINVTPAPVRTFLDSQPMTYWFVANGRRFIAVVKISTVFESLYAGLFLPYATPLEYPYPLFIGGSAGPEDPQGPTNWRSTADNHQNFVNSYGDNTVEPGAWMLNPGAQWDRVASRTGYSYPCQVYPWKYDAITLQNYSYDPSFVMTRLQQAYGGEYSTLPVTLLDKQENPQTYGILDGVLIVQGQANSSENLVTVNAVDHLVVQNVFRTDINQFIAVGLE